MTVIAVASDGTRVCMACDSQASNNGTIARLSPAHSKIVRRGELLFGSDGTMTLSHAVRYDMPEPEIAVPLDEWAARVFVPWLRGYFRERELFSKKNDPQEFGGFMVLAWRSDFVLLDGVGSVVRFASDWWAIGSGGAEARGAMCEAEKAEHGEAGQIARAGVEAAIRLDDGCCGPVRVEWTLP